MAALKKGVDYILDADPDGESFHVKVPGSDVYVGTVRRFLKNSAHRRWGARPYDSPHVRWITQTTQGEAVRIALTFGKEKET